MDERRSELDAKASIKTQRDGWQPIAVGYEIVYVREGETRVRQGDVEFVGPPPNGDILVRHAEESLYGLGLFDKVQYVMPKFR